MITKVTLINYIFLTLLSVSCQSNNIYNLGFESRTNKYTLPDKWNIWEQSQGYIIKVDQNNQYRGDNSLLIEPSINSGIKTYGGVAQTILEQFEGERIELKAYVKIENVNDGFAGLLLRFDESKGPSHLSVTNKNKISGTKD